MNEISLSGLIMAGAPGSETSVHVTSGDTLIQKGIQFKKGWCQTSRAKLVPIRDSMFNGY
jgi:hypothetical protein